jgi:hypothetical protein
VYFASPIQICSWNSELPAFGGLKMHLRLRKENQSVPDDNQKRCVQGDFQ